MNPSNPNNPTNPTNPMNPKPSNLLSRSLILILFATFVLAFFPVWDRLVLAWSTMDEYSHGFLIIPLSCYILWRKKRILAEIQGRPSGWGLGLVIFSLLLYLFAHFAEILTLESFSMVLLLAAVVIFVYGYLMFKKLLFPLCLLLFMIPIPSQIYASMTVPLQLFVSKTSVSLSALLNLPVYREGNIIYLPEQTLEVARACSGLRSLVSLLTLSAIFGYFTLKSNLLRTLLFFSGIPAAILVNIIRVLLLILAFEYLHYDLTTGIAHTVFGMFIFFLALIYIAAMKGVLSFWDRSATQG